MLSSWKGLNNSGPSLHLAKQNKGMRLVVVEDKGQPWHSFIRWQDPYPYKGSLGLPDPRCCIECWSLASGKPGQQWGNHGAADWGWPVVCGHIHRHLHITGGPDAPAPALDFSLPTRPCAMACTG
jgi:hypothetical protein